MSRIFKVVTKGDVDCICVGRSFASNTAVWFWRIGDTLIDSGCPNQWDVVKTYVSNLQSPLRRILISHHHEDHSSNAGKIQRHYHELQPSQKVDIYAPKLSYHALQEGFHEEFYRRIVWGDFRASRCQYTSLPLDFRSSLHATSDSGASLSIQSVHAPGHSPDHSVFYVPERKLLFSADLLVTSRPKIARFDENVLDGISSLQHIVDNYDIQSVYCAHRGPLENGIIALKERLAWLLQLRESALRLKKQGLSPHNIRRKLVGREDLLYYLTMGHFSKQWLIDGLVKDA